MLILVLFLMLCVLIDCFASKKRFMKQMMMSKQEVKEEVKQREGRPEIKSKRKELQSDLLKKSQSLNKVENADCVLINPTHVAVLLHYNPNTMMAPIVIGKGEDEFAMKIKQRAIELNKPVVRNINLARQLYRNVQIDCPVSEAFFDEVAEVYQDLIASQKLVIK